MFSSLMSSDPLRFWKDNVLELKLMAEAQNQLIPC